VAASAKLCYSPVSAGDLLDKLDEDSSRNFVGMLSRMGHESPLEHAVFTFAIEGVSRALLAQITRHRIASYSVQSQRYVNADNFSWVTPPHIASDLEALSIFNKSMADSMDSYTAIAEILLERHKQSLMAAGEPEKSAAQKAKKMAIEDARYVLPNAATLKWL